MSSSSPLSPKSPKSKKKCDQEKPIFFQNLAILSPEKENMQ